MRPAWRHVALDEGREAGRDVAGGRRDAVMVPADWQDFGEMIGGASGALTGLLFVSVSLNASRIAGHKGLRASAAQTLLLVITPLVAAAAVLTPDQPDWVLGAELVLIGLLAGWVLLVIHRVKLGLPDEDRRLIEIFNRPAPNLIALLLIVASGAILAAGANAGLYLLLPATIMAFVSGVINAWFFLLPPQSPGKPRLPAIRAPHHAPPGEPPADPPAAAD
jgi:hypothetical protein